MPTIKHLQVVSGSQDVTFTSPNQFTFRMPNSYISGNRDRLSLKSLFMYYSWFNITAAKNNNSFSYIWSNGTTYPVVLSDGIWSFADLQAYLQQVMKLNNHYLTDATGTDQFYLSIQANSVSYRISLTSTPVPTALPAGWTAPGGFAYPGVATTPRLIVPATAFQAFTGFVAATYPAAVQATIYQVNSTNIPQVTDSSSLQLLTNLAYNEYAPDQRTLTSFNLTPGTVPGTLISQVPPYQDWVAVQPNTGFQTITLLLVDQLSRAVKIEDPSGFICTLNLETSN